MFHGRDLKIEVGTQGLTRFQAGFGDCSCRKSGLRSRDLITARLEIDYLVEASCVRDRGANRILVD